MRRGTWLLAVSGALALHAGGVSAADPIPTRYTRPPTSEAAPQSKNYYEALFGATPEAASVPAAPVAKSPAAPARAAAAPAPSDEELFKSAASPRTPAKRPESAPPSRKFAAVPASKPETSARVTPASAESPAASDKNVIQAAFDRPQGESERNYIQPVRFNTEAPRPAAAAAATSKPAESSASSPMVSLEWTKKSDLNVGKECQLELVVKNTGSASASQVEVDAAFPGTIRLTSAEPKPAVSAEKLTWTFSTLPAGSEKRIAIKLVPSTRGDLGAQASVRFTGQAAAVFKVEEPLLKVDIRGPAQVQLGDPATQILTISNPGTGIAQDVKIEAQFSEGLEHRDGRKAVVSVGSLGPGESQQVRLGLSATKGGAQSVQLSATSSCEATCEVIAKITVIAPSLQVAMQGPGLRYKGRNAKYTVTVTNDGPVANSNVRVTHAVPDGFQFVSADRGGKFDASQKCIHWFLGRMDAGQTQQLNCELTASSLGDFKHTTSVNSDSGVRTQTELATRVDGIAAIDAEIVDLDDPVEVGSEAAWEIRVRNTGSKAATNIAVNCELPYGVDLISAKGPTASATHIKDVSFKSLAQLAPGQQAIYRVHVRGKTEGAHRLRARVSSDALDQPLSVEEATKFYADSKN